MESIEAAERVPPEQEIHVSYLAVYPLSNEGCDTVAIDTAVGTCSASLTVRRPSGPPLSSYPDQCRFRVWVRQYPLSIARFVDPAAPRVVRATQHEGHHSGTLARPDGLTVPGFAYGTLACAVGDASHPFAPAPGV